MRALILATILSLVASALCDDPLCLGVPPGEIFLIPDPNGDCTRYYECVQGLALPQQCPAGLWFNAARQICDLPEDSGCRSMVCPPGIVDFFPVYGDCTQYIECYLGTRIEQICPVGLWFNRFEKRCVIPIESQCGDYATSVEPPYTTPTVNCWGVLPGDILLKPYPGDCTLFIECIGSSERILSCPPLLYFDYSRQMCDMPVISGCREGPTPPPYTTPDPVHDDPRCYNGNNDYWPDADCTKFVECWEGHGYLMECPSGLYFDPINKICETPSVSHCGASPTPPPPPTTSGGWTPDPDCPWPDYNRYLFPYVGNCNLYIVCYWGEKTVEECPPGLWFNQYLSVCDYPYHSGCIWG